MSPGWCRVRPFSLSFCIRDLTRSDRLFYYNTEFAWRLPLILGLVPPLLLLALYPFDMSLTRPVRTKLTFLCFALPETPRWLCLHGRSEEARRIVERMHASKLDPDHHYAQQVRSRTRHIIRHKMLIKREGICSNQSASRVR